MSSDHKLNMEMIPVDFDPFAQGEIQLTAPATEAQKEIWASVQMGLEANCAFNESMSIQAHGALNVQVFCESVNDLIARHEAFRTTFSTDGAILSMAASMRIDIPVIDLSEFEEHERNEKIEYLLIQEVEEPFDLEHGPLIRAKIIKQQEKQYRIFITAHHIICDGWSMAIALQDLGRIYRERIQGNMPDLPAPSLFSEYAFEDQKHFESDSGREAEDYWVSLYSGEVPVLDFPTTRPRPQTRTFHARRLDYPLPTTLVKNLKKTGAKAGCTFITVLIAGFKSFLYRVTGQEDLVLGTPAAGQSATGRDRLVGHCVNLLPLRSQVAGETLFSDYLKTIRNLMFDAYEFQRYTFGRLIRKLDIPREPGRIPLVPIIFNIDQKTNEDGFNVEGIESDIFSNHRRFENFEMFLNVTSSSSGDKVVIECTYNANLFSEEDIQLRMTEFETLLGSVCDNPDQSIDDFAIMPEDERNIVLNLWNDTRFEYPNNRCMHQFVEDHARTSPERCAAIFEDKQISYGELNDQANRLAAYLENIEVGPGQFVGICMERSLSMLVGLLGILKSGAAYVPLDPDYPKERINYMVNDSGLTCIVTQSNLMDWVKKEGVTAICMDSDWDEIAKGKGLSTRPIDPESVAYVIYTSGSTGQPKGVKVPHRALTNFLMSMKHRPGLTVDDVLLAVTTLSFDIAGLELYLPLVAGARLVIASRDTATDGAALIKCLEDNAVTAMQATPSTWRMMLDSGWQGGRPLKIMCGGEAFPRDLVVSLIPKCREVWNMYGPTETTIWSVINKLENPDDPILIGSPIGNTRVYVLDKKMNPVPVGVSGELYIGGDGVAHGYMNKPELTSRQFLNDPFNTSSLDSKMYKTGDLCRFHPNGKLEYINRLDNQIKLRGYRIELGEIESVISQYESVKQSVVICKELGPGDMRLAAYIVLKPGHAMDEAGLRNHLRSRLPSYMIPQYFLWISDVPLTPAGKTDRKKLTQTFTLGEDVQKEVYEPPETQTEIIIAGIWEKVLKTEKISRTDNFFDLGGHSLLATQVIALLKKELNCSLLMRTFFESPTISGIALFVDRGGQASASESPRRTIEKINDASVLPLSLQQQRIWFLEQLEGRSMAYNLPAAFRLKGALNIPVLEKSIREVFKRHDILRTSVRVIDDFAQQIIQQPDDFCPDLMREDLSSLSEVVREEELQKKLAAEASHLYSLSDPSLFRAVLYTMGENNHVFFFMPHHFIWDGWSFDIFLNELKLTYAALVKDETPRLPELPIQYSDFSTWQRKQDQDVAFKDDIAYWQKELGDHLPTLQLPNDFPRPATMENEGASELFKLSKETVDALTHIGRKHDTTLFMMILSVYLVMIHRYSGQEEIILGVPISGRNYSEISNLIGFFVNTLPIKFKIDPSMNFSDLLTHVRDKCLNAFNHQEAPFERLVELLNPKRDLSRHPVFQSLFIYQDVRNRQWTMADLGIEQVNVSREASQTDIDFWVRETGEGMTGGFEYYRAIFRPETIQRMVRHFQGMIQSLILNPGQQIQGIYALPENESRRIIHEFNNTDVDYNRFACIHDLVAEQAEQNPHAPAVSHEDKFYTYDEVERFSNKIARILQDSGAVKGSLIGVSIDRSAEMIMVLLGILKAGGAYVPLDPEYPHDRLAYMISDSNIALLVTQTYIKANLPKTSVRTLCIDEQWETIAQLSGDKLTYTNGLGRPFPEDIAYVIYTSGSTGFPKGVKVPHRSVVNFLTGMSKTPGIISSDKLLAVTTLSFDIHVLELFLPLIAGAQTIIVSRDVAADGMQLLDALRRTGATMMQATPSTWRLLISAGLTDVPHLKILCGGEAFPLDLAEHLLACTEHVWNMYGPTETTVWSTCCQIISPIEGSVPVGYPIANTQTYILDSQMQPVPIGVAGELFIGGDGVTHGYLNKPDLTARQFVPDSFIPDKEALMYKTGDQVKYLPDGNIVYLNRIDNQVKVRGFRIELGEIESVLSKHEAVKQAVVTVNELGAGDQRLVAYTKTNPGMSLTVTDVRKYLQKKLPGYMIPQHVVELEDIPMTPAGKIDRKSLPGMFTALAHSNDYVEPRTDMEKIVADIWKELLKTNQVSIYDNFFELGGHSLLSVQVVNRIKKLTGKTTHLRSVLLDNLEQIAQKLSVEEQDVEQPQNDTEHSGSFGKKWLRKIKKTFN